MNNTPIRPSFQMIKNRSIQELSRFYQHPIAKVSTELFLTIIAVVFLAVFAISPTLTTMSQLLKDIEDRKQTDQALTKKIAALSTVSNDVLALQNDITLLHTVIPNKPDLDGLLRRMEKIASTQNIILTSIKVEQVPRDSQENARTKQLNSITLDLTMRGTYPEIQQFLSQILIIDRFISLTNLSLNTQREFTSPETGASQTNTLQARATLQAYYYGVPPEERK